MYFVKDAMQWVAYHLQVEQGLHCAKTMWAAGADAGESRPFTLLPAKSAIKQWVERVASNKTDGNKRTGIKIEMSAGQSDMQGGFDYKHAKRDIENTFSKRNETAPMKPQTRHVVMKYLLANYAVHLGMQEDNLTDFLSASVEDADEGNVKLLLSALSQYTMYADLEKKLNQIGSMMTPTDMRTCDTFLTCAIRERLVVKGIVKEMHVDLVALAKFLLTCAVPEYLEAPSTKKKKTDTYYKKLAEEFLKAQERFMPGNADKDITSCGVNVMDYYVTYIAGAKDIPNKLLCTMWHYATRRISNARSANDPLLTMADTDTMMQTEEQHLWVDSQYSGTPVDMLARRHLESRVDASKALMVLHTS
jgi:hypothetical protein